MISQSVKEALQRFVPAENIKFDEPLKNHTTFRVGGTADCMVFVQSVEQMQKVLGYLRKVEIPFFMMGNGSNLLVGDKGYRGVILRLAESMSEATIVGNRIIAQAGASLAKVARMALEHGLTGFEFAAGIPGTVGGAVIMNAGAYDGEMKMVVGDVTVIDSEGEFMTLSNETMEFGYRTSAIKNQKFVVTECSFVLKPGNKEDIKAKMDDFAARRREKQPLEYASAGSTFKRPEGNFAGKLIMDAGLRGFSVGGAQVSEKHCGFVINTGNATAADVKKLMEKVQEEVYRQFSIKLEPEVIMLGEFS